MTPFVAWEVLRSWVTLLCADMHFPDTIRKTHAIIEIGAQNRQREERYVTATHEQWLERIIKLRKEHYAKELE